MSRLVDLDIFAERIDASRSTARRIFERGLIPGVILSQGRRKRLVRFRESDIEAFINAQTTRIDVNSSLLVRKEEPSAHSS